MTYLTPGGSGPDYSSSPGFVTYRPPAPPPRASKGLVISVIILFLTTAFFAWQWFTLQEQANRLAAQNLELHAQVVEQKELEEARQGFLSALDSFGEAVGNAGELFDLSEMLPAIAESKRVVFENPDNVREIKAQTDYVVRSTAVIVDAVQKYENRLESQKEAAANSKDNISGTIAEQALDDITDGTVSMVIGPNICDEAGDSLVVACVSSASPRTVSVVQQYIDYGYDYDDWYMIMMHEFGHVIQFENYRAFASSNGYLNVFNADVEWYADCMAMSRIGSSYRSGYGYSCSQEQLSIANDAWNLNFR